MWRELRSVVGKSGVIHQFIEVELSHGGGIGKVVDALDTACDVIDVFRFRLKAIDIGARKTVLKAPSFTEEAKKLALELGIDTRPSDSKLSR